MSVGSSACPFSADSQETMGNYLPYTWRMKSPPPLEDRGMNGRNVIKSHQRRYLSIPKPLTGAGHTFLSSTEPSFRHQLIRRLLSCYKLFRSSYKPIGGGRQRGLSGNWEQSRQMARLRVVELVCFSLRFDIKTVLASNFFPPRKHNLKSSSSSLSRSSCLHDLSYNQTLQGFDIDRPTQH